MTPPSSKSSSSPADSPTRYVAFLRGINVGGHAKIAMADLRAMLVDLGYTDVSTLLQSGNAVFTTTAEPDEVASTIETRLHADTKLNVKCVVRTADEMRTALSRDPYQGRAADPAKYVVAFMDKPPTDANIATVDPAKFAPDEFRILGREAYIWCPNGLRDTKLTAPNFEKRLGVVATVRNWNTCQKVLALMEQDGAAR
jgi:uncharacterized protein (DUF1697 family)